MLPTAPNKDADCDGGYKSSLRLSERPARGKRRTSIITLLSLLLAVGLLLAAGIHNAYSSLFGALHPKNIPRDTASGIVANAELPRHGTGLTDAVQ